MNQKILFSPVGGTDPIKYCRDGSLLHICRHYRPDVVYLYLSHEILEKHREDNRYVDSLEKLGRLLNHTFTVHVIERDEMIEVQQYDVFYQDFTQEIRVIEQGMDESDLLLLNMASGTPAMKSALLVMATLAEYRFCPIQVATPQKKMNEELENRKDYDKDLNWELDDDNEAGAPNRCTEVKCLNLIRMLKIETIKKHVGVYDYAAALAIAEEIRGDLSEDAYRLLQIADARIRLQQSKISALLAEKKYDIYPVQQSDKKKIFEYALVLQRKIAKKEYADFIRGITPLVVDLLEQILKNVCGIALRDCCIRGKEGELRWNQKKLEKMGLWDIFDREYHGGFRGGIVYAVHLKALIAEKCADKTLVQKIEEMTEVERTARNMAAHEIVSVTEAWFVKRTGKTVDEIFALIRYLTEKAGIHAKQEDWQSYDRMNEQIVRYCDA